MDNPFLLSDGEVAEFIVKGYHLVEPELPTGLNESIANQLDALDHNPGDAITEAVPELWQVLDHPQVQGALISLLGKEYEVQSHRHWHCKQPHSGHMNWHQDGSTTGIRSSIAFSAVLSDRYYARYGPDRHRAGHSVSQRTNRSHGALHQYPRSGAPSSRLAPSFWHYDLWHGTAANRSDHKRHMIKFLFRRTKENEQPSWNHDRKQG